MLKEKLFKELESISEAGEGVRGSIENGTSGSYEELMLSQSHLIFRAIMIIAKILLASDRL